MKKELCVKQIYDDFVEKVILNETEKQKQMLREALQSSMM